MRFWSVVWPAVLAVSAGYTQSLQTSLLIKGEPSELAGTTNGARVSPAINAAGLNGTLVAKSAGSVNFTPAVVGNGVYFLNCCATDNAYYKFTGANVGQVFNVDRGQVSFYLKSRYSFAQRQATASSARVAFDVRDNDVNNHLFYFLTQASYGYLLFSYVAGGGAQFYFVPPGTEDALFGSGVSLKVTVTWDGSISKLYLNDVLVQTSSYTKKTPDWTATSNFNLGATEYATYGGYNSEDDVIDEFSVSSPAADTAPPVVSLTAPASGSSVAGDITVGANATSNIAMSGVQFKLDGANLGNPVSGTGPSYTTTWNTTTVANGSHTLSVVATDTSGNSATSAAIPVTVANPPVLSGISATSITGTTATIVWATDIAATSRVNYGLSPAYSFSQALATLMTAHSISLTGLTPGTLYHYQVTSVDALGNAATSADYTFTTEADAIPPTVSIQSPTANATVSGLVQISVSASDHVAMSSVQLNLDGAALGPLLTGAGPGYTYSWDTRSVSNGQHTLSAVATNTSGKTATARVAVKVSNPPIISAVSTTMVSSSGATISWTTDIASDTTVAYGLSAAYGSIASAAGLTVSHTLSLTGLSPATKYHFQVTSKDAYGVPATSADYTFTTEADTTPPTVTITAPASGAVLSGIVTLSANATSTSAISSVQFQLDKTNIGNPVSGAGPAYTLTWDTTGIAAGAHTLSAVATNNSGNAATASVNVSISNPPVISALAATAITDSSASITWTTDRASDSTVAYGTTTAYGSTASALGNATAHSVTLTGLSPKTTYHFQATSKDALGNGVASADQTFTTEAPSGLQTLLQISADSSELSGLMNGSTVTPTIAPPAFAGKLVVKNGGSVNFAPAQTGDGVYFTNCCATNNAYYKFTGSAVGNIFNVTQGQVTFYLKSRYSWAERRSSATASRIAFDVRDDDPNNHLFYFLTQVSSGYLLFSYTVGGGAQFYFVPPGTEDTVFGSGALLKVTITWDGSRSKLYFNDALVQSSAYTKPAPNWTSASNFNLGATEYSTYGGYNSSDDIIDEFSVAGPPIVTDTTAPTVYFTAPAAGSSVTGTVPLTVSATDNVAMGNVQFRVDGTALGSAVAGSGPVYSYSWDSTTVPNGSHMLSAVATDASGNTATATLPVTVDNPPIPPVISAVSADAVSYWSARITWTTDKLSDSTVEYGITTAYGLSTPVNTLVAAHAVNLTGLAASTTYHFRVRSVDGALNSAVSGDYTFATSAAPTNLQTLFDLSGDAGELSGTTNGSMVTPTLSPAGFTGRLVVKSGGSVNFAPAQTGDGVYFTNCCDTNNAYYKFTGATVGSLFNTNQGQVTFYLKSRYSWTQRQASAISPRVAFDVRDNNPNNHIYYFSTQVSSGYLLFSYTVGAGTQFYFVPKGNEDALFGNGALLKVTITWDGSSSKLYLNDVQVQSATYTKPNPSWTSASNFNIGASEYTNLGGYNSSDDIIDEFTIIGPPIVGGLSGPTVTITSPAASASVAGMVSIAVNATSDTSMQDVQFKIDGSNQGTQITGTGPAYTYSWDSRLVANGAHTIQAVATDTAGNNATGSVQITVANTFVTEQRIQLVSSTNVYASASTSGEVAGTQLAGARGTIAQGPAAVAGANWWSVTFDTGVSGWVPETSFINAPGVTLPVNTWVTVQPSYDSTPGQLFPQGWVNRAAYDPLTHRILFSDRWYDSVRGGSIFANGIYAFDPTSNAFSVLKLNNWYVNQITCPNGSQGCYTTSPLPANSTDPTPPDHHPLSGLEVVPEQNALYTVNGVNSYLVDPRILNATWRLDLGTKTWQKVSSDVTDPNHPPNIGGAPSGLVYDSVLQVLVQFVPSSCGCKGTATYLFDPSTNKWSAVPLDPSAANVYVAGAGVAFDSKRGVILAFGGNNFITNAGTPQLWSYSVATNRWTRLADAPFAGMAAAFAYDSKYDIFLALGGDNTGNNTYIYNPVTDRWSQFPATLVRPPQLSAWQAMAYDPAHDVFVFQGGSFDVPMLAMFRYDPAITPTITIDTHAPTVSFVSSNDGDVISGWQYIYVNASDVITPNTTDQLGVVAVQFLLDGVKLGAIVSGNGPQFSIAWNTNTVSKGPHTLGVIAYDSVGNTSTATIQVTINNAATVPVLSSIAVTSITSTEAIINWTTDTAADSQVSYGLTSSYGLLSTLGRPQLKAHAIYLTGLTPSTTYHYQARSSDADGELGVSADLTFTTAAEGYDPQLILYLKGDSSEVSGTTNGSTVTPATGPNGFTGNVVVRGTGSVNFEPAQSGNGVYFLACCDNVNNAYYKFSGAGVGNVINPAQGRITFYLKSRYSFAQRVAGASAGRIAFDVHDHDPNNHLFYFATQISAGYLAFSYSVNGTAQYYYVPSGMEDVIYGTGVPLKVTMTWDGTTVKLYLNDSLVQSAAASQAVANWSPLSAFSLGAADYGSWGAYKAEDDVIGDFRIIQR